MKNKSLDKIEGLKYFDTNSILVYSDVKKKAHLNSRMYEMNKSGKIMRLKKGIYTSDSKVGNDENNLRVIATSLKKPSYLSLEYVLRMYNVLTEATYGYTLVTTKFRSTIQNDLGSFRYYQIKPTLFTGYEIVEFENSEYYIASKAKALFDWLYYRKNNIPKDNLINLVEDLRLNLHAYTKKDFKELLGYTKLIKSKRLFNIISNIINNAHN
jgi:predicted transcriptional regulator of viral defense system